MPIDFTAAKQLANNKNRKRWLAGLRSADGFDWTQESGTEEQFGAFYFIDELRFAGYIVQYPENSWREYHGFWREIGRAVITDFAPIVSGGSGTVPIDFTTAKKLANNTSRKRWLAALRSPEGLDWTQGRGGTAKMRAHEFIDELRIAGYVVQYPESHHRHRGDIWGESGPGVITDFDPAVGLAYYWRGRLNAKWGNTTGMFWRSSKFTLADGKRLADSELAQTIFESAPRESTGEKFFATVDKLTRLTEKRISG